MGKSTRVGNALPGLYTTKKVAPMLTCALIWFGENAHVKERFGIAIDCVGVEVFLEAISH